MEINLKLSHLKGSEYNINIDLDPERIEPTQQPKHKVELGTIKRPDAERLEQLKNPKKVEEDADTEAVIERMGIE